MTGCEDEPSNEVKHPLRFVNLLLGVLWEAWSDEDAQFHSLVLAAIYVALNESRPSFLSEILCLAQIFEGDAPQLETLGVCSPFDYEKVGAIPKKDMYIEGDINFDGGYILVIKTGYKINWPSEAWYEIPVTLRISVRQLKGRVRLLYSNSAKSHLQFMRKPAVTVDVEPVLGEQSKLNLKSLPKVTSLIADIVEKSIYDLTYPQMLEMPVPCVSHGIRIDKQGNVI